MSETAVEETACTEGLELGPPHPVGDITAVLQALADPIRLAVVRTLASAGKPRACCHFDYPVTKSTMSHHFRVLREAGIIEQHALGTRKLTSLRREALDEAYPGLLESILRPDAVTGPGGAMTPASPAR